MTNVEKIYELFLSQIDDELFALLRPDVARRLLNTYLEGSIAMFKTCKKELKIDGFNYSGYSIDMGEDTIALPKERPVNIEIIGNDTNKEYKNGIDYKIIAKDEEDVIEFEYPVSECVSISCYENGNITSDLTSQELRILAMGMIVYWLKPKLYREINLKQAITDSDYKRLSGANMLDKVIKLYTSTLSDLELEVIAYSYESTDFKGFN